MHPLKAKNTHLSRKRKGGDGVKERERERETFFYVDER